MIKALELEAWRARQQEQVKAGNWSGAPVPAAAATAAVTAQASAPVAAARPVERPDWPHYFE